MAKLKHKQPVLSSDSEDDCDGAERMKYEELRQKNMKDNAAFFSKLGIDKFKNEMSVGMKHTTEQKQGPRSLKRVHHRRTSPPSRRSSARIKKIVEEKAPVYSSEPDTPPKKKERSRVHVKSVPIKLSESACPKMDAESREKLLKRSEKNTKNDEIDCVKEKKVSRSRRDSRECSPKPSYADLDPSSLNTSQFSNLTLTRKTIAKVVPNRIYSTIFHPTEDMVLVVAGDRDGKIGLWDVKKSGSGTESGVVAYSTHSDSIPCIKFHEDLLHQMYSCSFDGAVRCSDFTTGDADEIYCASNGEKIVLRNFDFLSSHTLVVSQSDGCVAVLDTRTKGTKAEHTYTLHKKPVRSVSVHPLQPQYIATASADRTVCLWDIRNLKPSSSQSLETLPHGRSVGSAFFSPLTGKHLLTTADNHTINIYDTASPSVDVKLRKTVPHNNKTGKWLTPFKATWHPAREDLWVVGSLDHPRQIEVFNEEGSVVAILRDDFLCSVCSCNCFHPTRNVLAGGNASGRVHLFM